MAASAAHETPGDGRVVVVGAGICGTCCATYLQRLGRQVLLLDRQTPGEACSFGNAGSLSPSSCVPDPAPGMWRKVPGWLLDRDGPLSIRWRYLPRLAPWLWRFLKAGSWAHVEAAADALNALHSPTFDLYTELSRAAGAPELVRPVDYLHLYTSEQSFRASEYVWRLRRERGIAFDELDAAAIHALEPDISPRYVRGMRIPGQGYTINPSRLVKSLAAQFVRDGGELVQTEARDFEERGARVTAVRTGDAALPCEALVIAAGAYSRTLIERLGLAIPLDTERGYHVTVADAGVRVTHTVMESERKFLATPMEMGVRFAGTVELASVDAPPDYRRADSILRSAKRMYPGLRTAEVSRWMGCRPAIPDGLPVIGRSPRHENVFLAFGHGHTGMIGSPMTGRLIAGMVTGQPLNVDARPFRADRF